MWKVSFAGIEMFGTARLNKFPTTNYRHSIVFIVSRAPSLARAKSLLRQLLKLLAQSAAPCLT